MRTYEKHFYATFNDQTIQLNKTVKFISILEMVDIYFHTKFSLTSGFYVGDIENYVFDKTIIFKVVFQEDTDQVILQECICVNDLETDVVKFFFGKEFSAPQDFNYAAMDSDYNIFAFKNKPVFINDEWIDELHDTINYCELYDEFSPKDLPVDPSKSLVNIGKQEVTNMYH